MTLHTLHVLRETDMLTDTMHSGNNSLDLMHSMQPNNNDVDDND